MIHKKSGDIIKKDDIILELETGESNQEQIEWDKQLQQSKLKLNILDRYIESIKKKENLLKNEEAEQIYFLKINSYLENLNSNQKEIDLLTRSIEKNIQEKNRLLSESNNKKLLIAEKYAKEHTGKQQSLNQLLSQRDSLVVRLQQDNDESIQMEIQNKNKDILDLEAEMNSMQSSQQLDLQNEQSEVSRLFHSIDTDIQQLELKRNELTKSDDFNQLIREADEKKEALIEKIDALDEKLKVKKELKEQSLIRANNAGLLHYFEELKQGDAIQQQQKIGFIFTETNQTASKFIDAFIAEEDRNKVNTTDEVKIYLNGVNANKFKFITGKIEAISNSLKKDDLSGGLFYSLKISLNQDYLKNEKEIIQLKQSMPTISYIVYEKESLLDWFLKQLNFQQG
ncbi:HlyD family efflux transporter periplasmic adaptor subunit [Enterococcus quebecensis]|nr:HlyD family efflux transporter periplasmic adaptor subunit [Enterococcus quebecensis]